MDKLARVLATWVKHLACSICILVGWIKPLLKIGTANTICWNYLGLFRDYSLDGIFLGIKLFCFSR
jgi:hypothetical protein